jgi:arabinogalactan oligomer/maltooligosaccharide transport system permease protein
MSFYVGKGFFDTIPDSMIEAAKIDGAIQGRIFFSIILPMSKPIIIYTALITFMVPWMDFIMARVILGEQNVDLHTTAVGLYYMLYGQRVDSNVFTMFAAGCLLIAVPIVSLFLSMQKFYVEGITAGSVKN